MPEVNYEAVGRCEVLRSEIGDKLRERHVAYSKITTAYRGNGSNLVYDTVTTLQIDVMQSALNEVKEIEAKIKALVVEYNEWAEKCGKKEISFSKY